MKTFGKKGIWVIFIVLIAFMLPNTMIIPGLINTVIPVMSETYGIFLPDMLTYNGYIGWIGLPTMILWAKLGEKKGAKFTVVAGLFGCAISFVALAFVTDMATWCIASLVSAALTKGLGYAGPALIANWFPTKKGIALGWATMGIIFVDLLWTPYIPFPIATFGFTETLMVCAVVVAVIAVIAQLTIKNTPEEAGAFPDNIEHPEVTEIGQKIAHMKGAYVSEWTFNKVLKNPTVWKLSFATGFLWMASSGPILTFYGRMGDYYDVATLTVIYSVGALCSLFGSWLFGYIDQKTDPKKALLLLGVVCLIGTLVMLFIAPMNIVIACITTGVVFACTGGIANIQASLITSLWGRWDYSGAAKLIQPVAMFFVMNASTVMGYTLGWSGSYDLYLYIMCVLLVVGTLLIASVKMTNLGKSDDDVAIQVYGKTMAQLEK